MTEYATRYLAAAAMYRAFLGWPAYACDTVVWMRPSRVADAVILPVTTAELVLAELDEPPPVVETPGAVTHWTLLTRPRAEGADMRRMIMLPPTEHPNCPAPLRWRHPPSSPLPEYAAVAAALDDRRDVLQETLRRSHRDRGSRVEREVARVNADG